MANRICSIDGCEAPVHGRGWCSRHYSRWERHGDPGPATNLRPGGTCSVNGCDEKREGHGYCRKHLRRWKKHGDPLVGAATRLDLTGLSDEQRREYLNQRARERANDWYAANRERALQNVKAYKENYPERVRQHNRNYRAANRERIDQRVKEWQSLKHPDRRRAHSRKATRLRRARRHGVQAIPFTPEQ